MADEEQLRILKQGPEAWNKWRKETAPTAIDLSRANLSGENLRAACLRSARFSQAKLIRADLSGADLREANFRAAALGQIKLIGADLTGADLSGADLSGADLSEADLVVASLRRADLSGARIVSADLRGAHLGEAYLNMANFTDAYLDDTIISNVDLSGCKNLDSIRHDGPSVDRHPDLAALRPSAARLPARRRPAGHADRLSALAVGSSDPYYSCFISYSSKDEDFAHRLHADLQDKGVRCWFAPHDMKIGAKILDTLDEAIRLRDKVLLVLSEAAIASDWVEDEVTKAFAEERQRGGVVLFPVRLDDAVFATKEAWAAQAARQPQHRRLPRLEGPRRLSAHPRAAAARPPRGDDIIPDYGVAPGLSGGATDYIHRMGARPNQTLSVVYAARSSRCSTRRRRQTPNRGKQNNKTLPLRPQ